MNYKLDFDLVSRIVFAIITRMDSKKFIFVIRKPDGQEYDMAAVGRDETDAARHLENLLDAIASRDTIVSLKGSKTDE